MSYRDWRRGSSLRTYSNHLPSPLNPSCGRGITWTLTTEPTCAAAAAPESVAAFTAATSPRKNTVTYPLPTFSQPVMWTFADLSAASAASTAAQKPLHSIIPTACFDMFVDG